MKKIIFIAIIIVAAVVGYKMITKKSATSLVLNKVEKTMIENSRVNVGDTIVCPICSEHFVKTKDMPTFDTEKCEKRYNQLVAFEKKEDEFSDKAGNVVKDVGDSIKKNFGK